MTGDCGSSGRLFVFAQACYTWLLSVPPIPHGGGEGVERSAYEDRPGKDVDWREYSDQLSSWTR